MNLKFAKLFPNNAETMLKPPRFFLPLQPHGNGEEKYPQDNERRIISLSAAGGRKEIPHRADMGLDMAETRKLLCRHD